MSPATLRYPRTLVIVMLVPLVLIPVQLWAQYELAPPVPRAMAFSLLACWLALALAATIVAITTYSVTADGLTRRIGRRATRIEWRDVTAVTWSSRRRGFAVKAPGKALHVLGEVSDIGWFASAVLANVPRERIDAATTTKLRALVSAPPSSPD